MAGRTLIRTLGALAALAFLASCAEYPTTPATVASTPPPMGYWNGDGVPGAPKIIVSISEQHAYFFKGKNLVGESTVSTGKPGFGTPPGHYTVLSKDPTHVSTVFGDYVDDFGNVVKSNIDSRKDSRPAGSHYDGARMPYAMFFRSGYAMHQGYVPPYAASHGCIRVPREMAETFFDNAPVGTPVIVKEEAVMHTVSVPPLPSPPRTVATPAPSLVRSAPPAPVRPASVRATVPAPTPIPVRSPAPVVSRGPAPAPLRSPSPAPLQTPARNLVRSTAPAPVRPGPVRSTVPAPTPVARHTPAPALSRAPAPAPLRSPSPAPLQTPSSAPAAVRPAPTPIVSFTPSHVRSKSRHHARSRTRRRSPTPSPTPTPPQ
ncbi:MAG TPA: L,D-transpeptidase family protein [Chthoniobacterales bacterium]|nr:L,D-transpeptidase family protein [Chthoniobacterales bacterium]